MTNTGTGYTNRAFEVSCSSSDDDVEHYCRMVVVAEGRCQRCCCRYWCYSVSGSSNPLTCLTFAAATTATIPTTIKVNTVAGLNGAIKTVFQVMSGDNNPTTGARAVANGSSQSVVVVVRVRKLCSTTSHLFHTTRLSSTTNICSS